MTVKETIDRLEKMIQENEDMNAQNLIDELDQFIIDQRYEDDGTEVIEFNKNYIDLAKWFCEVCFGFKCCVAIEVNKVIFS